jgi:hypothetical protein
MSFDSKNKLAALHSSLFKTTRSVDGNSYILPLVVQKAC